MKDAKNSNIVFDIIEIDRKPLKQFVRIGQY